MKTINIKGKEYVTVNERLKAFREDYKSWSLESEILIIDEDKCAIKAIIKDESGRIIATGTALEKQNNAMSMVNKTSHVENCETSAWGRALGNLGIGIDTSVASAEEVVNAVAQKFIDKPKEDRYFLVKNAKEYSKLNDTDIANYIKDNFGDKKLNKLTEKEFKNLIEYIYANQKVKEEEVK